jgi:hypothetical protein
LIFPLIFGMINKVKVMRERVTWARMAMQRAEGSESSAKKQAKGVPKLREEIFVRGDGKTRHITKVDPNWDQAGWNRGSQFPVPATVTLQGRVLYFYFEEEEPI